MANVPELEPEEWEFWDTWTRAQRLLTRELDRGLQCDCGISKVEFSVLMALRRSSGGEMRVGELAESLGWEKSRVSHQLTRMEKRGLVGRVEGGAGGRRTAVRLTASGRDAARDALPVHAEHIRRWFFDPATVDQVAAIRAWSEQLIDRVGPGPGGRPGDGVDGSAP